jgi:hypothetical protein
MVVLVDCRILPLLSAGDIPVGIQSSIGIFDSYLGRGASLVLLRQRRFHEGRCCSACNGVGSFDGEDGCRGPLWDGVDSLHAEGCDVHCSPTMKAT